MSMYRKEFVSMGTYPCKKRLTDSLELEWQTFTSYLMWVLGREMLPAVEPCLYSQAKLS